MIYQTNTANTSSLYSHIGFTNIIGSLWGSWTTKNGFTTVGVTDLRSDGSRYVFFNISYAVVVMKLDASGFQYSHWFGTPVGYIGGSANQRGELEIIESNPGINYKLAVNTVYGYAFQQGSHAACVSDIDYNTLQPINNWEVINYPFNISTPSEEAHIHGLEFSPDGNFLYISHTASTTFPSSIDVYTVGSNAQPDALNVTNSSDFQFSQIELGQDLNLYFATSNRLAKFSNPNTPNIATPNLQWTNNALPITYNFNYATSSFSSTKHKSYILPDQVDGMDYMAHFASSVQCCLDNTTFTADNFSAPANATWTGISNPLNGGTSSTVTIKESLVIPAGKTVTIQNMTFRFAPGAKVIIERGTSTLPGGKLILDGTTFTVNTDCDPQAMWYGVQVYGDNTKNQTPYSTSKQGWFIMKNGSVVEHSLVGAMAVKRNTTSVAPFNFTSYDFTYTGGVIRATDSYFKNNRTDVEFRQYLAPNNINNQSYFTNCEFTTNGLLNNPALYPVQHVYMNEVVGIGFYGNIFQNLTPSLYTYPQLGRGIFSVNAHYYVKAQCTSFSLPCTSFNPNVFQDLFYGIYATSSNSLRTVFVDRNDFINNYRGIYLSGPDFATITRNDFEVNRSAVFGDYGVYLNACTGYKVEENTFTEYNDPNFPPSGNTYGVIVNNSGTDDNEIYNNDFHDIKIGGQSQGINASLLVVNPYPNNIGLRWKCNLFYNDVYQADLSVTSGRIAYQQGFAYPSSNPLSVSSPAGNEFSHSLFDPQNDIAANNSVLPFNYAHHADLLTTPIYYNAVVVVPQICASTSDPVYISPNSCPSKIIDGGIIVVGPQLQSESNNLKELITQKEALIDGGNTQNLLSIISSQSTGNVKNALTAASPYLSDEVLLAYLSTNPPVGHVKQIILANSPVSDEVMAELNAMNLPNGIQNQINNAQTGISAFSFLQQDIGYSISTRNSIIEERIRLYLNDTIVVNPIDSVIAILKEEERELRKKQLCDAYIIKGDTVKANQTLLDIIASYGYDNFCKMAEIQILLKNYPSACYPVATDPNLKQQVETVAYDANDRINCAKAEALLVLAFDTLFVSEIEPLLPVGSGRMAEFTEENSVATGDIKVLLYPNPADEMVTIGFMTDETSDTHTYTIELFSVTGQKITSLIVATGNTYQFNTGELSKGIYFVKILEGATLIETKKLIINR
ncbi:MAG: T9SS type A sorting domain-containing protein [Flavobacteriales bacterium]